MFDTPGDELAALMRRAKELALADDFGAEALQLNERILELDPDDAAACTRLGRVYAESGRLDAAEEMWRRALRADPSNRIAKNRIAEIEEQRRRAAEIGRWRTAAAGLSRASEAQSIARSAKDEGDLAKAAAYYLRASELDDRKECLTAAAAALRRLGEYEQAEMLLLGVLSADPEDPYARNALAALFCSRREHDRALRLLERIIASRPKDRGALLALARVYSEMGRKAEAEEAFRRSGVSFSDIEAHRSRG